MSGARARPSGSRAMAALLRREIVRLLRQPSRVIGTFGAPALLWVFLAAGFGSVFDRAGNGGSYALFLLPGMATLVAMFSAIFSAMSLIEDRHEGVLQGALVSAAPGWSVVGAKALGASVVAGAQAAVVLLGAPLVDSRVGMAGVLCGVLACVLAAAGVAGLGLAAAWKVDSSQGFHGVMNVVLMPMWLLSGAFFPAESSARWMSWLMALNPLRWSTDAIRGALVGEYRALPWLGSFVFAGAMLGLACWAMGRAQRR